MKIRKTQKKEWDFLVMQEEWMWVYQDVDKHWLLYVIYIKYHAMKDGEI